MNVTISGELLVCSELRVLYWPGRQTLFVSDVHLGKAASFRSASVPVPSGTTDRTLHRLSIALDLYGPTRLVILGDLWHAAAGRILDVEAKVEAWRCHYGHMEMILVEGNHDRKSGKLPHAFNVRELETLDEAPFHLCHEPCTAEGYVLCGHLHPGVAFSAKGTRSLRLPCFWFAETFGVLPAFGEFTGFGAISPSASDQIIAIGDNKLHRIPPELAIAR